MKLTKTQLSLLLYLETRAVDHLGIVDLRHMNKDDVEIARKWNSKSFLSFKRFTDRDFDGEVRQLTYKVVLSDNSWSEAHKERKDRGKRNELKR